MDKQAACLAVAMREGGNASSLSLRTQIIGLYESDRPPRAQKYYEALNTVSELRTSNSSDKVGGHLASMKSVASDRKSV